MQDVSVLEAGQLRQTVLKGWVNVALTSILSLRRVSGTDGVVGGRCQ